MTLKKLNQIEISKISSETEALALTERILRSFGAMRAENDLRKSVDGLLTMFLTDTALVKKWGAGVLEKIKTWNLEDLEEYFWVKPERQESDAAKDFAARSFQEQTYILAMVQMKLREYNSSLETETILKQADVNNLARLAEEIKKETSRTNEDVLKSGKVLLGSAILYIALDKELPNSWKTIAYVYMRLSEGGIQWLTEHIGQLEETHPARRLYESGAASHINIVLFNLLKQLENTDNKLMCDENLADERNATQRSIDITLQLCGREKEEKGVDRYIKDCVRSLMQAVLLYVMISDDVPAQEKKLSQVTRLLIDWGPYGAVETIGHLPADHPSRLAFRLYENAADPVRNYAYQEILLRLRGTA